MLKILSILSIFILISSNPSIIFLQLPEQTKNSSKISISVQKFTNNQFTILQAGPSPGINNSNICPTCDNTSSELASQIASVLSTLIATMWSIVTDTSLLTAFTIALVTAGLIVALKKKGLIG